jgi:hypothetical protein
MFMNVIFPETLQTNFWILMKLGMNIMPVVVTPSLFSKHNGKPDCENIEQTDFRAVQLSH